MRGPSPLYIEERHRALGRDATFSWSRALTHPPRYNRTRHRGPPSWCRGGRHLGPEVVGPPSWTGSHGGRHLGSDVVGAAILDRKCGGRHLGSDVVTSLTLNWGLYYLYSYTSTRSVITIFSIGSIKIWNHYILRFFVG